MSKINRRSFLGLLKLLPFVPLVAKLPAAPVVEQAAEMASDEGGFLVPAEFSEQIRNWGKVIDFQPQWPRASYTFAVSQELLDDEVAFRSIFRETFAKELQLTIEQDIVDFEDKLLNGTGSGQPTGIIHP